MGKYNYSIKENEKIAKAVGRDLPISSKHSIEISNFIRGKNLLKMKSFLKSVIDKKLAVPFKRFNMDVGHRPGMGAGRYPVKAATYILKLLESVESNAKDKSFNVESLYIYHISAQKASRPMRYGRHTRRETKRTHVEIAVKEGKVVAEKKNAVKKETKTNSKPAKVKTDVKKTNVKEAVNTTKSTSKKSDGTNASEKSIKDSQEDKK